MHDEPEHLPDRLPPAVVALIAMSVGLLTLAFLGMIAALFAGTGGLIGDVLPKVDLRFPDDPFHQMIWVQSLVTLLAMVLLWALGIAVVATHLQQSHSQTAGAAVIMVRASMVIIAIRVLLAIAIPVTIEGTWTAGILALATNVPMALIQMALLVCADIWLSGVQRNAA